MLLKLHDSQKSSNNFLTTTSSSSKKILLPSKTLLSSSITTNLISLDRDSSDLTKENSNISDNAKIPLNNSSGSIITTNYSQFSLINKIILSILRCIIELCKLNYEWKDHKYEQSTQRNYRYHHNIVNSNPLTEYTHLYVLLITPLLSNLQVSNYFYLNIFLGVLNYLILFIVSTSPRNCL